VTSVAAVPIATTSAATRFPLSRSVERPIGARVSMIPNSSSTTMAPT
jgi:hypothetical protein